MTRARQLGTARLWAVVVLAAFALSCHVVKEGREKNLMPNPGFVLDADDDGIPDGWDTGFSRVKGIAHSRFSVVERPGYDDRLLKVVGGRDLAGYWWCTIKGIQPYRDYVLEFDVIKAGRKARGHPAVELLGQTVMLDQIGLVGKPQHVRLTFHSGKTRGKTRFRFINNTPAAYLLGRPVLRVLEAREHRLRLDPKPKKTYDARRLEYFPVAALGRGGDSFDSLAEAGFNCAVVPPDRTPIQRAHQAGLNVAVLLPDKSRAKETLESLKQGGAVLVEKDFFILGLRPEMRGVEPDDLAEMREGVNTLFPGSFTLISLLRPRFAGDFRHAADGFLIELKGREGPASLMADKMESATSQVSQSRLYALVDLRQNPVKEARAAAFLAVAHGASGLFFRLPERGEPPPELKGLTARLGYLEEWLTLPVLEEKELPVGLLSPYTTDPRGWPAIHTAIKRGEDRKLFIAVNAMDKNIRGELEELPGEFDHLVNVESRGKVAVKEGRARVGLGPYDGVFLAPPQQERENPDRKE